MGRRRRGARPRCAEGSRAPPPHAPPRRGPPQDSCSVYPSRRGRPARRPRDREGRPRSGRLRSEEHTSELQSRQYLVCRLLLEKKKTSSALPTTSATITSAVYTKLLHS